MKHGVVRLVNEGHVFSVSQSKAPAVYPQRVLMDTGAQPVMLDKRLAAELGLVASDLDSCPFMVATSLGGTEQPRGITKGATSLEVPGWFGRICLHCCKMCGYERRDL